MEKIQTTVLLLLISLISSAQSFYVRSDQIENFNGVKSLTYTITLEKPPLKELQHPNKGEYEVYKPHWGGIWYGCDTTITEPYTGIVYHKDRPIEIYGINHKWRMYKVRYYGKMCWFTQGEITEAGQWKYKKIKP